MVIYGASGHCKVVIDILEANGIVIDYVVDDNAQIASLLGYEVVRDTGVYDEALIAIGACDARRRVAERIKVGRYVTAVHPSAVVSPRASVGEGTVVMQGAVIQSCASVGRHCIVNTGASVGHDVVVADYVHIASHATVTGGVSIGDGTWIGAGAVVRQGTKIGRNCMIGAGSVVVSDIPDGVVAFGNPCRVVREMQGGVYKNAESNMTGDQRTLGGG